MITECLYTRCLCEGSQRYKELDNGSNSKLLLRSRDARIFCCFRGLAWSTSPLTPTLRTYSALQNVADHRPIEHSASQISL